MVSTKSIVFDGVDDYIDFGDISIFQKDYTDSFSMSCWAKTVATAPINTLTGKMNGTILGQPGYLMFLNASGQFEAVLRNTVATNSLRVRTVESRYNEGGWHHFAMTYDGADILLYVDGVVKATTTVYSTLSSSILASGKSFQAGAYDGATLPFAGHIDEVAFFDDVLSASEVLAVFSSARPANLLGSRALSAWWQLGENVVYPTVVDRATGVATFPTIPDDSVNSNDGTMTNMLASNVQVPVPWSKFSQYSYGFDGVNEYITMGDVLGFEYDEAFSISFWLWTTDTGLYRTVIGKVAGATTYRGWWVSLAAGQIRWVLVNDSGSSLFSEIITDAAFNDGLWHHVVCTYSAATPGAAADLDIFVDGVDVATTAVSSTLGSNTILNASSLNVSGYNDGGGNYFSGYLTDVAVYGAELDQTAVTAIYNAGEPNDLRLLASASDLVAYWRLGAGPEVPDSTWNHKIQQWKWDTTATKESVTITDATHLNSPGTLYNMDASNVTTDTPGGISNYSCTFNGVDESMYSNVASTIYGAYKFENGSVYSLAGWVKCSSGASGWLWGNGSDSLLNWSGYGVYLNAGKPQFVQTNNWTSGTNGTTEETTTATVDDGGWHFVLVCMRYDKTAADYEVKIYIDGVSVATTRLDTMSSSSSIGGLGWSIGARALGQHEPVAAQCDEVAVWTKFLTLADATALYNSGAPTDLRDHKPTAPYLRGWWRLGDPYFAPGASVNMEYYDKAPTAPGAPTHTNRSLYFDSVNDHVVVPHNSAYSFDIADPFSVSGWICAWDRAAFAGFFAKGTSGAHWKLEYYGYFSVAYPGALCRITLQGTTGLFEVYIGGSQNQWALPFAQWTHLVVTYDGSNNANGIKAYINGEEWPVYVRYNIAMSGTMQNASDLWMGRASAYWSGYQDEMSVWSKELSQADVTELFNGGDPADLSDHTSVANLVGWWRMGEGPGNDGTMVNMAPTNVIENAPRYPKTAATTIDYFLMRGIDSACGPLTYHHWTVTGSPDFAGAQAGTLPCGGPLTDIIVAASWSVYN